MMNKVWKFLKRLPGNSKVVYTTAFVITIIPLIIIAEWNVALPLAGILSIAAYLDEEIRQFIKSMYNYIIISCLGDISKKAKYYWNSFTKNPCSKTISISIHIAGSIFLVVLGYEFINWVWEPLRYGEVSEEIKESIKEVCSDQDCFDIKIEHINHLSEVGRNRAWVGWMALSLLGVIVGIFLTWWGRILQQKTHAHERYEKTAEMLGNELMSVRIAGCRGLANLANDDKRMPFLCARLLLSYINRPYLSPKENEKLNYAKEEDDELWKGYQELMEKYNKLNPEDDAETIKQYDKFIKKYEDLIEKNRKIKEEGGDNLELLFPTKAALREDIKAAADSLSDIYRHAYDKGKKVDDEAISLPRYFLLNESKNEICLAGRKIEIDDMRQARLQRADLREANLEYAELGAAKLANSKLQKAVLKNAKLREVDFRDADLTKANLEDARLQHAKFNTANLTNAILVNSELQHTEFWGTELQGADLTGADLTNAKLKFAKGLTRKQILLAEWGLTEISLESEPVFDDDGNMMGFEQQDRKGIGERPTLPDDLDDKYDEDMQEWLAKHDWVIEFDGEKVPNPAKIELRERITKTYKTP